MKLRCNKCYGDLEVVEYDCGIFVEPCENCSTSKEELEEIRGMEYDDGYDAGKSDGYDEAEESYESQITRIEERCEREKEELEASYDFRINEVQTNSYNDGYNDGMSEVFNLKA